MKLPHQSIPQPPKTTLTDVVRWTRELERLHAQIASRFARPEPHRRTLAFLQGVLSDIERKNGWQLAEHAREARPDGMQRLLTSSVWDVEGVRDDLRAYVLSQLGTVGAILVLDETSFKKRGTKSAGVAKQYCGSTGQVENCQVGVFLSYVTARGHALIDRELYLPIGWIEDHERRNAAGIPEAVRFQTKPELARQMLERVFEQKLPLRWVVADSVYGSNLDLRAFLEEQTQAYVLAVPCDEPVGLLTSTGRRYLTVEQVPSSLSNSLAWHRLAMSEGTKGPRLFDWAALPVLHRWQDDHRHWLLIRRSLTDPPDTRYYFVFAPEEASLPEMVEAIGARWTIEEDFEAGKALGLDQYEVRIWIAWYRYVTLVILALAFLTGICASEQVAAQSRPESLLLPLSRLEVCHLLGHVIWPPPCNVAFVLTWSWWRRYHGCRARACHRKRCLQTG